jgi:hypothetical protein
MTARLADTVAELRRSIETVKSQGKPDMLVTLPAKDFIEKTEKLLDLVEREVAVFTHDDLYVMWYTLRKAGLPHTEELAAKIKTVADKRVTEGLA